MAPQKTYLPPPEVWRRRWAKILPTTTDVMGVVKCGANQRLGRAQAVSMDDDLLGEELKLPLRIRGKVPLGFEDEHRENPRTRNVVNGPPTSWQCHCLIRALVPLFGHGHGEWSDAFG